MKVFCYTALVGCATHYCNVLIVVIHREVCRLYQQRYREKVHSLSPSPSLLQEIQVLIWNMNLHM